MDAKRPRPVTAFLLSGVWQLTLCGITAFATWGLFALLGIAPRSQGQLSNLMAARSVQQLHATQTALQHEVINLGGQVGDVASTMGKLSERMARVETRREVSRRLDSTEIRCAQAARNVKEVQREIRSDVKNAVQQAIDPARTTARWPFWYVWHWRFPWR